MGYDDTFFTNDSGAAGGPIDYVKDVFKDVSLPPSSNSGLTSTSSTNPLGFFFANDDSPRYGVKTLYIKSFTLIDDRTKWVNNKPTYIINWTESFPSVVGYAFGAVGGKTGLVEASGVAQGMIDITNVGEGIGITGVVRRVAWLVNPSTQTTPTAQNVVDGSNGTTINFGNGAADAVNNGFVKYRPYFHAAVNETYALHDIRLTALQASTLSVVGVQVYFEDAGANIDQFPGSSYVNKSKITTVVGATFALPSMGSSLGGKSVVYKTASSGYAISSLSATTMQTLGSGTSGSALLAVTTGTGGSFLPGYGLAITSGANGNTLFVGGVVSVSTDTLTMNPVLPYNITNANVYRSWYASASAVISPTLMQLAYQLDFSKIEKIGITSPILEPTGAYAFWGKNIGVTVINSVSAAAFASGGVGFMQIDGSFGALELEFIGDAILHATFSINGVPGVSVNAGQTGPMRRTIFAEGGPGWNSVMIQPGVSLGVLGISKVNMYQRSRDQGITFGALAEFETLQSYGDRGVINATLMSLGLHRRIYADQMSLGGSFARGLTTAAAGGVIYYGTDVSAVYTQTYYGKNFALLGTAGGGSITLDGVGVGLTFNAMQSVATEGFHTVVYTSGAGATSILQAFDYVRTQGEFKNLQNLTSPVTAPATFVQKNMIWLQTPNGYGSTASKIRRWTTIINNTGTALSLTQSAANGDSITVNEDGIYSIDYGDYGNGTLGYFGITLNSNQLTTSIASVTTSTVLTVAFVDNTSVTCSATVFLNAGDVLRCHTDSAQTTNGLAFNNWIVTKVG